MEVRVTEVILKARGRFNLFLETLISECLEEATDVTLIALTETAFLKQPSTCLISSLIKMA